MPEPKDNRMTVYMKPEDYELLQQVGRELFRQGFPVIESNGKINKSATIVALIRIASGKEAKK